VVATVTFTPVLSGYATINTHAHIVYHAHTMPCFVEETTHTHTHTETHVYLCLYANCMQFVNYAHHAIAYALWEKKSIEGFIQFVDALMSKQGDEFMTVAKVTAKDVAQQVKAMQRIEQ